MPKSNQPILEIIVDRTTREALSGEEICQALAKHQPAKFFSLDSSPQRGIVVVTQDDGITRVMVAEE